MKLSSLSRLVNVIRHLVKLGLPLDQGLARAARDEEKRSLKKLLRALASDLKEGRKLSESLETRLKGKGKWIAAAFKTGEETRCS